LKGLSRFGIEQFLPQLYQSLGDESWRIRKEAAEFFLALPGAGSLAGEIIELLHSQDNAGLRNTAVDILVRLGRQAVPFLLEELSCPDHDVRKFVLDILGAIAAPDSVGPMIECLADEDSNVRAAAAENLGLMKEVEAVPRLLQTMGDADLMSRFTILEALAQIGAEVPVAALLPYRGEKLLRQAMFDCLGHVGNGDAIPVLIEGLTDSMRNVREAATLALGRIANRSSSEIALALTERDDPAVAEVLAQQLESRRPEVRRAAVHLLGWAGNEKTAAALLPLVGDEELSREAAAALIAIGRDSACTLTRLWPDADTATRSYLAYILGEAGCVESQPLLLNALQQQSSEVQQAAAHALGRLGGAESPRAIAGCLATCDLEIMDTLVQSLILLSTRFPDEVLASVRILLEGEREEVRTQAVNVLAQLTAGEVDAMLDMAIRDVSSTVRSAAVRACEGRFSEGLWQSLLIALTDEESDVRRLATDVIGGSGKPEACDALQLAMQDDDIWVRSSAVRSLGRISSPEAIVLIRQALGDPVGLVVISALETLWETNPEDAYGEMVAALGHQDEEVVNAALKQLTYSGRIEWIKEQGGMLLNHHHWEVRLAVSRALVELAPETALPLFEARLPVEGEDLVQQQLTELIEALRAMQG
jgi:HEAT repeat protein